MGFVKIFLGPVLLVTGALCSYLYVETPATLQQAHAQCQNRNGRLATFGDNLKGVIGQIHGNTTLWTGKLEVLSSWINLLGCFTYQPELTSSMVFLVNTSAAACALHCKTYDGFHFALQGKRCLCIGSREILHNTDGAACSLICDGSVLSEPCGGIGDSWSLYKTVIYNWDTTVIADHCVTASCQNHHLAYYGSNCSNSYASVCSNGSVVATQTNWTTAVQACVSKHSHLLTNATDICSSRDPNVTRFWIGQFRGVTEMKDTAHMSLPDIVGCTLMTLDGHTLQQISSADCTKASRPYICDLNGRGFDTTPLLQTTEPSLLSNHTTMSTIDVSNTTMATKTSSAPPVLSKDDNSSLSTGAIAAIVIAILCVCALVLGLVAWRRNIVCVQLVRKRHDIGQLAENKTYDPSFDQNRVSAEAQEDNSCDTVGDDPQRNEDERNENYEEEDLYAHPTFDYDVTRDSANACVTPYLDMGAGQNPSCSRDDEYVYMGENTSDDMYTYISPHDSM